jgi:hypothetical protein
MQAHGVYIARHYKITEWVSSIMQAHGVYIARHYW